MATQRRLPLLIALGAGMTLVALPSCRDSSAERSVKTIHERVAEVAENESEAHRAPEPPPGQDPCAGVTQGDMDRVEEQMKHLNEHLVVFGSKDMQALACSRRKRGH